MNVAAKEKVSFNLTYQEILRRVHGVYKHIVHVTPRQQVVDDMRVEVIIDERYQITRLLAPEFGAKTGEMTNEELLGVAPSKLVKIDSAIAQDASHVSLVYSPSVAEQQALVAANGTIAGQMVVLYDVERRNDGGEMIVRSFIHYILLLHFQ